MTGPPRGGSPEGEPGDLSGYPHIFTLELRSLPDWLMRAYLVELGGSLQPDGSVTGEGWQARLEPMEDFVIGSLRVGQVRLVWCGDVLALESIWPLVQKKLVRGGG